MIVKNKICAIPEKVELTPLDNKSHIGSKKNVSILMINVADMVAYIESLEASIRCYENKK